MYNDKDVMVSCRKCGTKVPASQLKMDLDEKMMVCITCLKSSKNKETTSKIAVSTQTAQTVSAQPKQSQPSSEPLTVSRAKHACQSCGYKFNVNMETMTPRNCPYCGKPVFH